MSVQNIPSDKLRRSKVQRRVGSHGTNSTVKHLDVVDTNVAMGLEHPKRGIVEDIGFSEGVQIPVDMIG